MKNVIFIFFTVISLSIFFACDLFPPRNNGDPEDDPNNYRKFAMFDTVNISVGEKLYTGNEIWVRLDSISRDNRLIESSHGGVEAIFTIGYPHQTFLVTVSTDSLQSVSYYVTWEIQGSLNDANYVFDLISVTPPPSEVPVSQNLYCLSFVLSEYFFS